MDANTEKRLRENRWLKDEGINQLVPLLVRFRHTETFVAFITSWLVVLLRDERRANRRAVYERSFRRPAPECLLILIPIFDSDHWSLLVRCYATRQWLHFDSIYGYHQRYVKSLIAHHFDPLYARAEPDEAPFVFVDFPFASQQHNSWECGLFLLMNAYMAISYAYEVAITAPRHTRPPFELSFFLSFHQEHSLHEGKCLYFRDRLLALFSKDRRRRGDEVDVH